MKFRLLIKLGEWILAKTCPDGEMRADMFLPIKLLAFSVVLAMTGIIAGIYGVLNASVGALVGAAAALALGACALLCWKNQTITVLNDEEFEYSTFLGKKIVYRFSDIRLIRKNNDSMTVYVGNGKVHIESMAVLSHRLIELINRQLESLYGEKE